MLPERLRAVGTHSDSPAVPLLYPGSWRERLRGCSCAQVHHPNAVQFLGACTKQEPYILVTELMPGGSMADTFRMMKVQHIAPRTQGLGSCWSLTDNRWAHQWVPDTWLAVVCRKPVMTMAGSSQQRHTHTDLACNPLRCLYNRCWGKRQQPHSARQQSPHAGLAALLRPAIDTFCCAVHRGGVRLFGPQLHAGHEPAARRGAGAGRSARAGLHAQPQARAHRAPRPEARQPHDLGRAHAGACAISP